MHSSYFYSQTCVKQAPMGKPKGALIQVDFQFFAFNGIWNSGL